MPDRLCIGVALDRPFPCEGPVDDRLFFEATLAEMMSKQFRPGFNNIWELGFEDRGDAAVELLALATQQASVGHVTHERVFE
jgi:hypothetical protein